MSTLEDIKERAEGHTPGPWRFDAEGWLEAEPPSVHGYVISPGPYDHDEVQDLQIEKADAELIAAAPKLLAALEAVEALAKTWADSGSRRDLLYGLRITKAITDALA